MFDGTRIQEDNVAGNEFLYPFVGYLNHQEVVENKNKGNLLWKKILEAQRPKQILENNENALGHPKTKFEQSNKVNNLSFKNGETDYKKAINHEGLHKKRVCFEEEEKPFKIIRKKRDNKSFLRVLDSIASNFCQCSQKQVKEKEFCRKRKPSGFSFCQNGMARSDTNIPTAESPSEENEC